jgi:hypothetical protein
MAMIHHTSDAKEAKVWYTKLEAWLPLLRARQVAVSKTLARVALDSDVAKVLGEHPLLYFLHPHPPLWLHRPSFL